MLRTTDEPERAVLDQDWPVVAACAICLMFSVGTLLVYSFGVFVRPIVHEFHWTRTQVSGALTIGQFAVALSSPLWGFLVDRLGPRRVILPSIFGLSLAFASASLLTPHLWHFYLIFAAFSFFGGGASPIGYAAVLVRSFERHLGLALGLALMGIGLGATVLPSFAQAIVGTSGWRAAYAIMGATTLVITVPAALFATRHARLPIPKANRSEVSILPLIRTRAFLLMCGIFVLLAIASGGLLAHLVPMMIDRGVTPAAAARFAGLAGIAVIFGRGGIGWLLDRFNAARLLALVALTIVASLLLLLYAAGNLASSLAALLLGCVMGAEVDFTAFLVRRYFGNAAFGRLYGIAFGLYAMGVGVGSLLLGISFDRLGGYHPALLLCVALSLVAGLATFAMPPYRQPAAVLVAETAR